MKRPTHGRSTRLSTTMFRVFVPVFGLVLFLILLAAIGLFTPLLPPNIWQQPHAKWRIAGFLLIALIILVSAAWFLAKGLSGRFSEPILRLTRSAHRLSDRQWSDRDRPQWLEAEADPPLIDDPAHSTEILDLEEAFLQMHHKLARTDNERLRANRVMETIFRSMNDGVITIDAEGHVLLLTAKADVLLSNGQSNRFYLAPTDANEDDLMDLALMGTPYAHVRTLLMCAIERNEPITETLTLGGVPEQVLQVTIEPLATAEITGAIAVLHDVTRIMQLERMRQDFVANVTHELKTPLTSIRGYTELLQSGARDADTQAMFLSIIAIEAERLEHLIRDMLDLSAIESGIPVDREPLEVAAAIESTIHQLQPLADQNQVSLNVDVRPNMKIFAESMRFQQLLTNLVANAIAYNKPNGSVWIRAREERGMSILEVADTGIGIPEDAQDRIFERFYRVSKDRSRAHGGTGLGLSIVKHIVSLWGGTISVSSQPGEGTTFSIRLPKAK